MTLTPDNRITDAAYDRLLALYRDDAQMFTAAHHTAGLRRLCTVNGIDPDMPGFSPIEAG